MTPNHKSADANEIPDLSDAKAVPAPIELTDAEAAMAVGGKDAAYFDGSSKDAAY